MNDRAVHVSVHIAREVLLCKEHRSAYGHTCRSGNGNAARLNSKNLCDVIASKKTSNLLADLAEQHGIDVLIEKATNLEDISGEHLSIPQNLLFHLLHTLDTPKETYCLIH